MNKANQLFDEAGYKKGGRWNSLRFEPRLDSLATKWDISPDGRTYTFHLFQPSLWTIIFAISVSTWTGTERILRAEFMSLRERDFVTAARASGSRSARIITREILPNALPPMIVNASLGVGVAILFEAGLSFLGLGDPNVMSWGYMIGSSRVYIRQAWWTVTFPGVAIFLTVLSLSLVGDWLNDFLNPKARLQKQG